jgi:hypothetical protein
VFITYKFLEFLLYLMDDGYFHVFMHMGLGHGTFIEVVPLVRDDYNCFMDHFGACFYGATICGMLVEAWR